MELRLWRNKAQKAIIARQKAVAKLQALSTTRQAIENNKASFGVAKTTLASSIDQARIQSL